MKVRVSMPGTYMAAELDDVSAMQVFRKMVELLCAAGCKKSPQEGGAVLNLIGNVSKPEVVAETAVISEISEPPARLKYKGFMHIKCKACGEEKGFMMRKESDRYHCDCGVVTEFREPLVPLFVNCECGGRFRYLTNVTESAFDINCLDCSMPVAVKWNEKKRVYEPIRE